jgi:hypothetical protein
MLKLVYFFLMLLACSNVNAQERTNEIFFKIECKVSPSSKPLPDSIGIVYSKTESRPWFKSVSANKKLLDATWVIKSDEIINVSPYPIRMDDHGMRWIMEPGDSIVAMYEDERWRFKGKGSEKLNLINDIIGVNRSLTKPQNISFFSVESLEDYLEWDIYLDKAWEVTRSLFEYYKSRVNPVVLDYIKIMTISKLRYERMWKFRRLPRKSFGIDKHKLIEIFDRDMLNESIMWMRSQTSSFVGSYGESTFPEWLWARKLEFSKDLSKASMEERIKNDLAIYDLTVKTYKGNALEYILASEIENKLRGDNFQPNVLAILSKYYADKDRDTSYKAYIKSIEKQERVLKRYKRMPSFSVKNEKDEINTLNSLKGKVAVMFFYKTNNSSNHIKKSLKDLENTFKNDSFINWQYLPAEYQHDSVLSKFNIQSFPAVFVLNIAGRLLTSSFIDSSLSAHKLDILLKKEAMTARKEDWKAKTDGPYILRENKSMKYFLMKNGSLKLGNMKIGPFKVAADERDKYFNVSLHNIEKEPSVFPKPEKLLALSDIEGNFDALRLLLQKNGVIDESYNWTFGNGHLIFAGDMFDRGEQVTECLWLMYSLEHMAKAAGGYVHFILGNHELMNLNSDHRYVKSKYKDNAKRIGKTLLELYGPKSILGEWLRSKNIVEKIGDLLFLHGGISPEVDSLGLSVEEINNLAKPNYDKTQLAHTSSDKNIRLLFDQKLSPFWYRNYYLTTDVETKLGGNQERIYYKPKKSSIENILKHYQVSKIITGHTIYEGVKQEDQGKFITVHYDGSIINTDTEHAEGFSEALLVDKDKYYGVNKNGDKRLLGVK